MLINVREQHFMSSSMSSNKKSFPEVLMEILSLAEHDNTVSDIITWLPNGNAFIIFEPDAFADVILPRFFPRSRYASFTRKLNRWGFRQITKGAERGAFQHEMFLRDKPQLCRQMSCNKKKRSVNSGGGSEAASSPGGASVKSEEGPQVDPIPARPDLSPGAVGLKNHPSPAAAVVSERLQQTRIPQVEDVRVPQALTSPFAQMHQIQPGLTRGASNDFQEMLRYQQMSSALQSPTALYPTSAAGGNTASTRQGLQGMTSLTGIYAAGASSGSIPNAQQNTSQMTSGSLGLPGQLPGSPKGHQPSQVDPSVAAAADLRNRIQYHQQQQAQLAILAAGKMDAASPPFPFSKANPGELRGGEDEKQAGSKMANFTGRSA